MDLIRIRGLEIDCIVGVRPLEREREQRVHLELGLGLDLSPAGRSGRIALTCDYDQIATEVIAMLRFRHYHLIEMATEEIAAMLIATHPALELVEMRLDKPAALDGRARAASVEIQRRRAAYPVTERPLGSNVRGATLAFLQTRDAEVGLVRIGVGETVPQNTAAGGALEWLVAGEARREGGPVVPHVPVEYGPTELLPATRNTGDSDAFLFRCLRVPAP